MLQLLYAIRHEKNKRNGLKPHISSHSLLAFILQLGFNEGETTSSITNRLSGLVQVLKS